MKILIIDDEKLICDSIAKFLKIQGIENIKCCYDSREGERELLKNIYDVALIDLLMPVKNGDNIIDEAVKNGVKTEFIVLTAVNDIKMVVKCLKSGAFNYIVKPPDSDYLLETIRKAYYHFKLKNSLDIFVDPHKEDLAEPFKKIITDDSSFRKTLLYSMQIASTNCNILITGPSGAGKTMLAETIHLASMRNTKNFVSLNVNAVPQELFESALFGHKKGAFTGATDDRPGLLKKADGGTLFLDEIGDLSIANQIKILKTIEEKKFFPVGSDKLESSDFRLITATSKNLIDEIKLGNFRKELYYRIKICNIIMPSLQERKSDIQLIAKSILKELNKSNETKKTFTDTALIKLGKYAYPGNIRELRNIVENAFYKCMDSLIDADDIEIEVEHDSFTAGKFSLSLDELKEQYIKQLLTHYKDKSKTAEILGITLRQLYSYIKKYQIQ